RHSTREAAARTPGPHRRRPARGLAASVKDARIGPPAGQSSINGLKRPQPRINVTKSGGCLGRLSFRFDTFSMVTSDWPKNSCSRPYISQTIHDSTRLNVGRAHSVPLAPKPIAWSSLVGRPPFVNRRPWRRSPHPPREQRETREALPRGPRTSQDWDSG